MRVNQEFYCGNCQKYFIVRLNAQLTHEVEIVCPGCGHEHRRCVKEGMIFDEGRFQSPVKEKIRPTPSTLVSQPRTQAMLATGVWQRRSGVKLDEPDNSDPSFLPESWLDKAQRELTGD